MNVSSCGHLAPAAGARVCAHLTTDNGPGCFRVLTGVATRYDLLCRTCAEAEAPELLEACVGCFERAESDAYLGWRGDPGILRRDRALGGTWTTAPCAVTPLNDRCLAPLPDGWLARTGAGLVAIHPGEPPRRVATVDLPDEVPATGPGQPRAPALHTAADGRFAAAVTDYGRHGVVVDLASGAVTLALDRQDYHTETVRFPVAFLGAQVVAATDWNRLDVFEAATGRLLTERVTTREESPEHYLDYFQGALLPSPSGRSLLVDGWVWQPEGIPLVLDCAAWLAGETHAPEHGQALTFRDPWDVPMAWVDEETVALQEIGDERTIDGVQLHDARTGRRLGMFAGPKGPMWGHGGLLYVTAEDGFEVWDPADGARIGFAAGFRPTAHDPASGAFAELRNDQLRIWAPVG
ncbi:hypothetical protein H4696_004037 [Amycolatopsis lexingtonensis]|uniref:Uncharacterized protein n=1 Tax=Amycolatopsis lexingtonensis TaxID=218822 RepID=A0ABR9I157_9PSEU|nr:hypothetical protein [Amycolatopsis lexingtonensis]MBE1496937.1 hypothetical protein [Amycolatopsis lexingtonensis]